MSEKRTVAVIGGGVSGLSTAWHLFTNCQDLEVHLYESSARLGGHAHTVNVRVAESNDDNNDSDANVDVDVGFMVFNDENYPNMTKWFEMLEIESEASDMSLSVSLDYGKSVEWSSSNGLSGLLANKMQVFKPSFYYFLRDMLRFNRHAGDILTLAKDDPRRQVTIGQYLRQEGYSPSFATHYLLPMMAALWSASIHDVLNFPAQQLISFMCNHQMLQIFDRPKWKTIAGRSRQYTEKILSILGPNAHLSTPITSIQKIKDGSSLKYEIFTTNHETASSSSCGTFHEVVFACHAPEALTILNQQTQQNDGSNNVINDDASSSFDEELLNLLSKIQYEDNVIYVHSDPSLMPRNKAAWSSWNCLGKSNLLQAPHLQSTARAGEALEGGESGFGNKVSNSHTTIPNGHHEVEKEINDLDGENGRMKAVYVTYFLNKLQNLNTGTDIFVSLNPHHAPDQGLTYKKQIMAHPQFTLQTTNAREEIAEKFQGKDGLWFCGAWQGYGFHEDGCRAGFDVATAISSVPLPWCNVPPSDKSETASSPLMVLPPPDLTVPLSLQKNENGSGILRRLCHMLTYTIPVIVCKKMVIAFLRNSIKRGTLTLRMSDGTTTDIGDGSPCGCDSQPVTLRIFDDWFFVKIAMEYDLGLARSYMSGIFNVEPLSKSNLYDPVIRPSHLPDETNVVLGDPVGLTRLFRLFIGNRDDGSTSALAVPKRSALSHTYANAFQNAAGLLVAKIGSFINFIRYKITMDNSERGGSLKNIHAHYDLSNDLFRTFLDKETLMYSSAIFDAVKVPPSLSESRLAFRGTLEEAEWRKLDTLLSRAQIEPGQTVLDIGFGWGGLSLHAAKKYGCRVTGITLSVEQKALAEERVVKEGLSDLITFEVIDYRTFGRKIENRQKFDRVLCCEMIEAVGHNHLGEFYWAVEQVLHPDGILVMEAITTPEVRYEAYLRSTDFINTIIFPGGCCPSLHALIDASYKWSTLTLEHIDNIGLHYAETLREWRRRFNAKETDVRQLGFDDVFMRVWNYYMTYCEAGFNSQTVNCLILVFSRQGCRSLVPLSETRSVTQSPDIKEEEIEKWLRN